MKLSISHISLVPNLFEIVNREYVSHTIGTFLRDIELIIEDERLGGWQIIFQLAYNAGIKDIRIFRKERANPRTKQKYVTVHIPIPSEEIIPWGVESKNIINIGQVDEKWYSTLPCNPFASSSMLEHCISSAKLGIIHAFLEGVTIQKQRIKSVLLGALPPAPPR
jgi:hypothetical protein